MFRSNRIEGLVLKKFEIREEESQVRIVGRKGGPISFLLTQTRFDPTTEFRAGTEEIRFRNSSFFGERLLSFPTFQISHLECGSRKPFLALVAGGVLLAFGLVFIFRNSPAENQMGLGALLLGLCFLLFYILQKKIFIRLESTGGARFGLVFKRSVIENVPLDLDMAMRAIELISNNIIESRKNHRALTTVRFEPKE